LFGAIFIKKKIMQETKNLVEEAFIQMKNVEEVIAENAKGILASTMKEEISQLVKESLSEQETEDEVEMDAELDMVDMGDEADNDEEEIGMDDMEMSDEMDDMEMSDMEDTIDLTNASDEEILKIFKSMSEEDGIIVKKDGEDVHIKDTDEDVEYIVKLDESEEMEEFNEELDEEDTDLDAVLSALGLDEEMDSEMSEEDDEVVYEIEMSDEDDDLPESPTGGEYGGEFGMLENEDMNDSEEDEDMNSEDYHLEEAKMTVKPKGVGMGNPKFKYGKTLPKKGFDEKKKEGPKTMGTGKAKFEFKEGEMEENYGSKKHEYKRKDVDGVEKKAGEKKGHYKDYEKEETKEAARTYGMGSKEGRGLRKGITNNRNYNYTDNGVKVESVDTEMKMLREKNEEYRKALNVFREKLNEVAVFNSNLAYATRLFTEHSTTKKEKINILRRFDSVESLKESKQLYKTIKDELGHVDTKNINESVDKVVNNSMSSGSSQNLIESKTYENPQFLRIKDLMSKI
jgi:hypothetical protein